MEQKTSSPPPVSVSAVETIIGALSDLESDIDKLASRVEDMKKRIMVLSNEEINKLKEQIIAVANEEAKKIVEKAKAEAEDESNLIIKEAEKNLAATKKNIDSSFDRAVDSIVKIVLSETTPQKRSEVKVVETKKSKKHAPDATPAGS